MYETDQEDTSSVFEAAIRDYFVSLRWNERAARNVVSAQEEVKRAKQSREDSLERLKNIVTNVDEVTRTCSALLDPL